MGSKDVGAHDFPGPSVPPARAKDDWQARWVGLWLKMRDQQSHIVVAFWLRERPLILGLVSDRWIARGVELQGKSCVLTTFKLRTSTCRPNITSNTTQTRPRSSPTYIVSSLPPPPRLTAIPQSPPSQTQLSILTRKVKFDWLPVTYQNNKYASKPHLAPLPPYPSTITLFFPLPTILYLQSSYSKRFN